MKMFFFSLFFTVIKHFSSDLFLVKLLNLRLHVTQGRKDYAALVLRKKLMIKLALEILSCLHFATFEDSTFEKIFVIEHVESNSPNNCIIMHEKIIRLSVTDIFSSRD